MLPVDLEARRRGLVLGVELRLLQMVWPSGQTSTVSASTTALLELAASLLPRMSAAGRPAISASATADLRTAAGAGPTADLCAAASSATARTTTGLLVLHQRK